MSAQLTAHAAQVLEKIRRLLPPRMVPAPAGSFPGAEAALWEGERSEKEFSRRTQDLKRIVGRALRRATGTTALEQWIQGVARDVGGPNWRHWPGDSALVHQIVRVIAQTLDHRQGP